MNKTLTDEEIKKEQDEFINFCFKQLLEMFKKQNHTHYTARKTVNCFYTEIHKKLGTHTLPEEEFKSKDYDNVKWEWENNGALGKCGSCHYFKKPNKSGVGTCVRSDGMARVFCKSHKDELYDCWKERE